MSRIFMPAGWVSGSRKSNRISQDGVFAEHGSRPALRLQEAATEW
jgi:hypothetical protein